MESDAYSDPLGKPNAHSELNGFSHVHRVAFGVAVGYRNSHVHRVAFWFSVGFWLPHGQLLSYALSVSHWSLHVHNLDDWLHFSDGDDIGISIFLGNTVSDSLGVPKRNSHAYSVVHGVHLWVGYGFPHGHASELGHPQRHHLRHALPLRYRNGHHLCYIHAVGHAHDLGLLHGLSHFLDQPNGFCFGNGLAHFHDERHAESLPDRHG